LDRLGAAIIVPHLITKKVLLFKKIDAGLAGIEQIGELTEGQFLVVADTDLSPVRLASIGFVHSARCLDRLGLGGRRPRSCLFCLPR
jgi:hypothetical protein